MARVEDKRGNGRGSVRQKVEEPRVVTPVEPGETGREAFMRIAELRMNGLLSKLNTLSKLESGKSRYGYTDEDVEYIRTTLIKAVNAMADRLRRKPVKEGFRFEKGSQDASA